MEQTKVGFKQKVDKFFGISAKGSKISTEITAGCVTFLTMAYILCLNPSLITNDWAHTTPLWNSVFIATAFGAVIGTLLMALLAKMPLAQAPGLGLDSMVGSMITGAGLVGCAISFGSAMLIVLISGIIFLALSIIRINGKSIRELIFHAIPKPVRLSMSVGIGMFIALIGLKLSGIVIINDSGIGLIDLKSWSIASTGSAWVCIIGFLVIAVLSILNVRGSVIIGILVATIVGIPMGVTTWSGQTWAFWEHFQNYFSMSSSTGGAFFTVFTEGFSFPAGVSVMSIIMIIITFAMVDMFDTMGTVVGCCQSANLLDENGVPLNYDKIMYSDSIATCAGAMLGTSTVTTFVESGSGVAAGGRTGLTALTTAILFLLSIFLLPLFASIPSAAADAALIWVGCLMIRNITQLKIDSVKSFVPTFMTIAFMPFGYSITAGIGLGILSYVVLDLCEFTVRAIQNKVTKGKVEKVAWDMSPITIVIAVLFLVYFLVPTSI